MSNFFYNSNVCNMDMDKVVERELANAERLIARLDDRSRADLAQQIVDECRAVSTELDELAAERNRQKRVAR